MKWRNEAIGLGFLFLSSMLIGCSTMNFAGLFALQSSDQGKDRVIAGSVESAAQTTRASLQLLGLNADIQRDGDNLRVLSQTASGKRFALILTHESGAGGEQTRVQLEWLEGKDDPAGVQILAGIDRSKNPSAARGE